MEALLRGILERDSSTFVKVAKRRYGFDLNGWYNVAYGRTLLYGDITYEAEKNFRCTENCEKHKKMNCLNRKCFIILIQLNNNYNIIKTLDEIRTYEEFMCGQPFPDDIEMFMVGFIKNKYKQKSNKRFYINTEDMVVLDLVSDEAFFIEKRVTFDCIFHDEPTQTDSMLSSIESIQESE